MSKQLDDLKDMVREEVNDAILNYIEENPDTDKDDIMDRIDYSGTITEIVDGGVPIYNHDIMEVAQDSEIWTHENDLPPAFDGTPTPINVLATSIYEVLQETAWEQVREFVDELESDGCFESKSKAKRCVKSRRK